MATGKRQINRNLLDDVALETFNGDELERFRDNGLRVERILLDLVRPDPVQPRRVLPEGIYQAFHNQRLTPSQALREFVQSAQVAAKQAGRPFTNVLDLIDGSENQDDRELPRLSPE